MLVFYKILNDNITRQMTNQNVAKFLIKGLFHTVIITRKIISKECPPMVPGEVPLPSTNTANLILVLIRT